jgi:hypothetical protein
MDPVLIPGYLRSLANSFYVDRNMNLFRVRNRLDYMGWGDFDLDYYTYRLALDCLDAYGLKGLEYKPVNWFNNIFLRYRPLPPPASSPRGNSGFTDP